ncbi:MAG: glycosyltransferase family 4 protein [Bacteroidetes bacterium]|nr:glycosyltransferase family 4 protein [Bacteroidota bacterium]
MNQVLVIAYYFPPLGLSGVQRTLKFVKYLKQFGWQPTVLTVGNIAYFAKDDSLLKELDGLEIDVIRTDSLDPNTVFKKENVVKLPKERTQKFYRLLTDLFFIPDNKIGWKRHALKAADELFQKKKFDVVFATSPPQTAFIIGRKLKAKYKIPLVIDYRDAWVDYPFKWYPTPIHKYLNIRKERKVLRASDSVITASRRVKEKILRRYKFLQYHDVQLIPQGFDPADMKIEDRSLLPLTEKMRITYSGTFYEDRTPLYFFEALALAFKNNPKLRGRIEACFVGAFRTEHINLINKLQLQDSVNILGYLEHKEAVKYLLASDVLWVMMQDDLSSPGKIFEYIGAGKKILGCVPEGAMRQLIKEANGVCVDPKNVQQISETIVLFYQQFERKELQGIRPDVTAKYNRIQLTGELAKVLTKHLEI